MNTWADLRELRRNGMKPALPVIVTTTGQAPARTLADEGCLVIRHNPGEVFHGELLDGLRVWLFVGNCDRATAVVRSLLAGGIKPTQLAAWCPCFGRMDFQPVSCEVAAEWH